MPFHGGRKFHHYTTNEPVLYCPYCGEPFRTYWKDKEQLNGFGDTTTIKDGKQVHYFCIPGAKSLHELNEERKLKANKQS